MLRATELLSGDREPVALRTAAASIRAPVLLIASRVATERAIDRVLAARIGPRATLWTVDAPHTGGLDAAPDAYAARALGFLRAALAAPA